MRISVILCSLLLCSLIIHGDTIHLANGRRLEGEVIRETENVIVVRTYSGIEVEIPIADVLKIEKGASPVQKAKEELKKRLSKIPEGDADALYRLAQWCKEKKLRSEARELLKKVIEIDPDHAAAREELGYEKVEGEWVKKGTAKPTSKVAEKRLTKQQIKYLEKLITRYFKETDKQEEILTSIKERDEIPFKMVEHFRKFIFKEARNGLKVSEGETMFSHPKYRESIYLKVVGDKKEKLPLFVALHGGGKGVGHHKSAVRAWLNRVQRKLGKLVFCAPTVLRKEYAEWGGNPEEEAYVKELIKAVKRSFNIDTNRIYLAGYSMGGYGTWHIGGHQADVFAGLVSGAGGMLILRGLGEPWASGIISNLMHTPIIFLHGSSDRPAPVWSDRAADKIMNKLQKKYKGCYIHKYIEYPGGHSAAIQGLDTAINWVAKYKRNPYPKHIIWEPKRKFNKHFYWLKVNTPKVGYRIEAEIKGNTITVKTAKVPTDNAGFREYLESAHTKRIQEAEIEGGFSLLLNDELIDLKKKVIVKVNGKVKFNDFVKPSLSAMVESISDKIDENMWFFARIDF